MPNTRGFAMRRAQKALHSSCGGCASSKFLSFSLSISIGICFLFFSFSLLPFLSQSQVRRRRRSKTSSKRKREGALDTRRDLQDEQGRMVLCSHLQPYNWRSISPSTAIHLPLVWGVNLYSLSVFRWNASFMRYSSGVKKKTNTIERHKGPLEGK